MTRVGDSNTLFPEAAEKLGAVDLVDDRIQGRTRTQDRLRTAALSKRASKVSVTVRFEPALTVGG